MVNRRSEPASVKRGFTSRVVRIAVISHLLYLIPVGFSLASYFVKDGNHNRWQTDHANYEQAPDPELNKEAIIQIYAARAARWRGALGVHSWFAVKPSDAEHYTRIEVYGFHLRRYGNTISFNQRTPDRYWFGSAPVLLREIRGGEAVDEMITRLYEAAEQYPYNEHYRLWPGPNSNTFIAALGRVVPELQLELPVTAVGKDYIPEGKLLVRTPSGTGIQLSLGGLFGLLAGLEEGIEVTLLGFAAGVDLYPPALKLPGVGRIGFSDFKSRIIDVN